MEKNNWISPIEWVVLFMTILGLFYALHSSKGEEVMLILLFIGALFIFGIKATVLAGLWHINDS